MASVKVNSLLSLIRNFSGMVFPLISFPYLSRMLEPEGMGRINFVSSYTSYFVMLAAFGVALYGSREVAKAKNSPEECSKLIKELLLINLISCTFMLLVYFSSVLLNSKLQEYYFLFLVSSFGIYFFVLQIDWVFTGLEKNSISAVLSIIFQSAFVTLIFFFIRSKDDFYWVPILTTSLAGIQVAVSLFVARKTIFLRSKKPLQIGRHFKPLLFVFGASIASSVFVNLDTVMLGFLSTERDVGFYVASIRVNRIVIAVIASVGGVFIARLSYLLSQKDYAGASMLSEKWLKNIYLVTFPIIGGMLILAKDTLFILAGEQYLDAAYSLMIMIPTVLFGVISNYIGTVLYSQNREKLVFLLISIGATLAVILNFIFIPLFGYLGAAATTLFVEGLVFFLHIMAARKTIALKLYPATAMKYIALALGMSLVLLLELIFIQELVIRVLFIVSTGALLYAAGLLLLRDEYALETLRIIRLWVLKLKNQD